jgi:O-antigen ligase
MANQSWHKWRLRILLAREEIPTRNEAPRPSTRPVRVVTHYVAPAGPDLRRSIRGFVALSALAMALGYASFAQGAFYPAQSAIMTGLVLVAALVSIQAPVGDIRPVVMAFAALAIGLGIVTVVHGWTEGSLGPVLTLVASIGAFLAVRAVIRRGDRSRLLQAVASVGAAVAGLGILSVAFHLEPWVVRATGLWRAASTLTYANATAALLALTLPAAVLLAVERPSRRWPAVAGIIVAGLLATGSRGGLVGLLVMIATAASLGARRWNRALVRPLLAGFAAAAGLVPSMLSATPQLWPAAGGLVVGAVVLAWPAGSPTESPPRPRRALLLGGASLIVLATVFVSTGGLRVLGSRLNLAGEGRLDNWSQTLSRGLEDPLFGTGLPVFEGSARAFAHNEFLQVFADTGLVGLGAVAVAMALFAVWVLRARPKGPEREVWTAGVAAIAGFTAQSAVDFLWRFPVLMLLAFMWLATAGTRPATIERRGKHARDE